MEPYFYTFQEFLAMGKHGVYVWTCWGVTLFVVISLILYSRYQRRNLLKKISVQQARRNAQSSKAKPHANAP